MDKKIQRINPLRSLKTQMCLGTILLLGITVASISYSLIIHEKIILKNEIERSLSLQGKNISLSSVKALLRPDPEFELYPLINQLVKNSNSVVSVVVTDADGIIQGDNVLQNIGTQYINDVSSYQIAESEFLGDGESLYQNDGFYLFITPVRSMELEIGKVYLTYSKEDFHNSIRRAITTTLIYGAVAFILGIALSLLLFRHISRPLDALTQGVRNFGEGNLETKINVTAQNELRMLALSFNDMASKISKAQRELVIKERMERELEIAREIQSTLLPKHIHEPEGFEIGHYYQSATEVGGDYLDIIPIDQSRTALVMADVSGKGVPGLVVMAMVKIMVQEFASKGFAPKEVIQKLNISLYKTIKSNMFVTFFFAVFDKENSELVFSNAGHNPLLVYSSANRSSEFFKMEGIPIGVIGDKTYSKQLVEYRTRLRPGDLVLQYTDGLNESCNESGAFFKFDRILEISNDHAQNGAKHLISTLVESEREFRGSSPQTDDITLLALSALAQIPAQKAHTGA